MLSTDQEKTILKLRELYKRSLYATCKHLLGYKDINESTHGDMIRCLESDSKRKLIVMPRGTFKSSIGVVGYSIWTLLKDPNARILIDSEVYSNSKNFIREIKSHIESERFVSIFGDIRGVPWSEGEITVNTRRKGSKEASITSAGVSVTKVGAHFTHIIHDDMNSNNNSETSEMREKIYRHYQLNLAILEPEATLIVIGTRYATDDLIGRILDFEKL